MNGTNTEQEIRLTEKAVKQLLKIKTENSIPDEYGIRLSVKGGGCSGLSYDMDFDILKDSDTVIEQDELKILIDGKSLFYLTGTELDFSDGLNGKGFTFNNPNATKTCGCGESFGV